MTTVTDGLFQYGGMPVGNPFPIQTGTAYFVAPKTGRDGNRGTSLERPLKTLPAAFAKTKANSNDVVYLVQEGATNDMEADFELTEALDWNKNCVHLIGIGAGAFGATGARIANAASSPAIEDGLIKFTADNCIIANITAIVFPSTVPGTGALIPAALSGSTNRFINCAFPGMITSATDTATSRSFIATGGLRNSFQHCFFGSSNSIRDNATAEVELSAGGNYTFENCQISSYTSQVAFNAISCGTLTADVLLNNCVLSASQNRPSSVAPTGAIDSGTITGQIMVNGGGVFGYGDVTTADDTNVYVLSPSSNAAVLVGMGVAATTDVAQVIKWQIYLQRRCWKTATKYFAKSHYYQ